VGEYGARDELARGNERHDHKLRKVKTFFQAYQKKGTPFFFEIKNHPSDQPTVRRKGEGTIGKRKRRENKRKRKRRRI
jgi:hypothetical protein